ncbi:uncharacterized protein LOC144447083 isoform X2 [Glandiceps talaboti]
MVVNKGRPRCFFDMEVNGIAVGRIIFELYADICPKTCENFRALCTGELGLGKTTNKHLYYKGSPFHRIVKDFMIQGGDFTAGNGTGGESIYGGSYKDENFILKHEQEFLLSMANCGKDSNGSQFFITTKPAPHLDGVHVVFGHVIEGQTLIKDIETQKTDANSRPYSDIRITNCGELVLQKKTKAKKRKVSVSESDSSDSDDSDSSEDSDSDSSESEREKKKKKKKAKKKESKRRKKEKKKKSEKRKEKETAESESEEKPKEPQYECSIDPDEIPTIPSNSFLMRGNPNKEKDGGERRQPTRERSPPSYGTTRSIRSVPYSRNPIRSKSGRRIKGRGIIRYRSPSGSRSRSNTPPHWRQEQQRSRPFRELEQDRKAKSPDRWQRGWSPGGFTGGKKKDSERRGRDDGDNDHRNKDKKDKSSKKHRKEKHRSRSKQKKSHKHKKKSKKHKKQHESSTRDETKSGSVNQNSDRSSQSPPQRTSNDQESNKMSNDKSDDSPPPTHWKPGQKPWKQKQQERDEEKRTKRPESETTDSSSEDEVNDTNRGQYHSKEGQKRSPSSDSTKGYSRKYSRSPSPSLQRRTTPSPEKPAHWEKSVQPSREQSSVKQLPQKHRLNTGTPERASPKRRPTTPSDSESGSDSRSSSSSKSDRSSHSRHRERQKRSSTQKKDTRRESKEKFKWQPPEEDEIEESEQERRARVEEEEEFLYGSNKDNKGIVQLTEPKIRTPAIKDWGRVTEEAMKKSMERKSFREEDRRIVRSQGQEREPEKYKNNQEVEDRRQEQGDARELEKKNAIQVNRESQIENRNKYAEEFVRHRQEDSHESGRLHARDPSQIQPVQVKEEVISKSSMGDKWRSIASSQVSSVGRVETKVYREDNQREKNVRESPVRQRVSPRMRRNSPASPPRRRGHSVSESSHTDSSKDSSSSDSDSSRSPVRRSQVSRDYQSKRQSPPHRSYRSKSRSPYRRPAPVRSAGRSSRRSESRSPSPVNRSRNRSPISSRYRRSPVQKRRRSPSESSDSSRSRSRSVSSDRDDRRTRRRPSPRRDTRRYSRSPQRQTRRRSRSYSPRRNYSRRSHSRSRSRDRRPRYTDNRRSRGRSHDRYRRDRSRSRSRDRRRSRSRSHDRRRSRSRSYDRGRHRRSRSRSIRSSSWSRGRRYRSPERHGHTSSSRYERYRPERSRPQHRSISSRSSKSSRSSYSRSKSWTRSRSSSRRRRAYSSDSDSSDSSYSD